MVRQRVRIRFAKQGDLRLIGHRDLARAMARLLRRAGLKLSMSEGFHPKPRIGFPLALAVGIEGRDEVMELELAESCTADGLSARLAEHTVPGLQFVAVEVLPEGVRKAKVRSVTYQVPVDAQRASQTAERAAQLLAGSSCMIERPRTGAAVDLRRFLEDLSLQDGLLSMRLLASQEASAGPRDVLTVLGLGDLEQAGARLTRTAVELAP
jgi:radical SAM-linked protein